MPPSGEEDLHVGYYFSGDPRTGLYRPSHSNLALETAGVERLRVDAQGKINVGGGTPYPAETLHVSGNVFAEGKLLAPSYDHPDSNAQPPLNTASSPCFSFRGDSQTGMYNPSRNAVAMSSGGRERIRLHGDGNVGIGDFDLDLPSEALDVRGNVRVSRQTLLRADDLPAAPSYSWVGSKSTGMYCPYPDTVAFSTEGRERARITPGGRLGIGITNPPDALSVSGNISTSGEYKTLSDARWKNDIRNIESALEKVGRLRGCTYRRCRFNRDGESSDTEEKEGDQRSMGVIAQEIREIVPEVVHHDGLRDVYSVNYDGLVGLLLEAVKDVRDLYEDRLTRLEQRLASITG